MLRNICSEICFLEFLDMKAEFVVGVALIP